MFYKSDLLCPCYLTLYVTLIIVFIFLTCFLEPNNLPNHFFYFPHVSHYFSAASADIIKLKKMTSVIYRTLYYRVLVLCKLPKYKFILFNMSSLNKWYSCVGIQKTIDELLVCMFESRISGQEC